jgi:hypothetical protein
MIGVVMFVLLYFVGTSSGHETLAAGLLRSRLRSNLLSSRAGLGAAVDAARLEEGIEIESPIQDSG